MIIDYLTTSITKMLGKLEILILAIFFGMVPISAIFMATGFFAVIVFGKESLGPWMLWGLLPGVLINAVFLKRWVKNAYKMNLKVIGALYVYYSVCALGFFMGIPIGCILLSIPAGFYIARRFIFNPGSIEPDICFKRAAFFTAEVMIFVCTLITLLAIVGKMIGYGFESSFLSFTFTTPVFWSIVVVGGGILVLLQYLLTKISAKITFRLSN
jgi:hypothetical protein